MSSSLNDRLKECVDNNSIPNDNSSISLSDQFLYACCSGNMDQVKILLEKEIDPNSKEEGISALHYAAYFGHEEILNLLIENGANINSQEKFEITPLWFAAQNGRKNCVEILIEKNANFNLSHIDGNSPFHIAAAFGHCEVTLLLIQNGAKINATNKSSETALHLAASQERVEIVEQLVKHDVDIEIRDQKGLTAYEIAQKKNNERISEVLEEKMNLLKKQRFKSGACNKMAKNIYLRGQCVLIKLENDFEFSESEIRKVQLTFERIGFNSILKTFQLERFKYDMKDYLKDLPQLYELCIYIVLSKQLATIFIDEIAAEICQPKWALFFIHMGNNAWQDQTLRKQNEREISFLFSRKEDLLKLNDLFQPYTPIVDEFILKDLKGKLSEFSHIIGGDSKEDVDLMNIKYENILLDQEDKSLDNLKKTSQRFLRVGEIRNTTGTLRLFKQLITTTKRWYARISNIREFDESLENLFQCLMSCGRTTKPRLLLSVIATIEEDADNSNLCCIQQLNKEIQKLCCSFDTWLFTDGHTMGVSGLLRDERDVYRSSVIGVTKWQAYYDTSKFRGERENHFLLADCLEDPLAKELLHPSHSHFIFHDEKSFYDPQIFRHKLEISFLKQLEDLRSPISSQNEEMDEMNDDENQLFMRLITQLSPGPTFIKIVLKSDPNFDEVTELMKRKKDCPLIIIIEDEESRQECKYLRDDSLHDSIAHICYAKDIGKIVEFYLSKSKEKLDKVKKNWMKNAEYKKMIFSVIENDKEASKSVDWNKAIREKEELGDVMMTALRCENLELIESFYRKGYTVSDFLDQEQLCQLYEFHFKNERFLHRRNGCLEVSQKLRHFGQKIVLYSGQNLVNLYDEEEVEEDTDYMAQNLNQERIYTEEDLFFWSLMTRQFESARLFWRLGQNQVQMAIIAVGIIRNIGKMSRSERNYDVTEALFEEMRMFERLATSLVNQCSISNVILNGVIPMCKHKTVLILAVQYECGEFMKSPACRLAVDTLWKSHPKEARNQKIGTSHASVCLDTFDASPKNKIIAYLISHISFFILLSLIALYYFRATEIHILEYVAMYWTMDIICAEIIQSIDYVKATGPRKFDSSKVDFSKYFESNWNKVDVLCILLLVMAFSSRIVVYLYSLFYTFDNLEDIFLFARIPLNVAIFVTAVRTIQYFDANQNISVTARIAFTMFRKDVLRIGVIYGCFMIGFGVLSCALKYPFGKSPEELFRFLLHYPFWQLFGELHLDVFEDMPRNFSGAYSKYSNIYWKTSSYTILFLSGIFLIISNVLLLNLLIAMFGNTYVQVETSSRKIWAMQRFTLFYEYEKKTVLPPPFVFLWTILLLPMRLIRRNQESYRKCYAMGIELNQENNEIVSNYFRRGGHIIDLSAVIAKAKIFSDKESSEFLYEQKEYIKNDKESMEQVSSSLQGIHEKMNSLIHEMATLSKKKDSFDQLTNCINEKPKKKKFKARKLFNSKSTERLDLLSL